MLVGCIVFQPSMLRNDFNNAIKNYRDENDFDFKPNINAMIDFLQSKVINIIY